MASDEPVLAGYLRWGILLVVVAIGAWTVMQGSWGGSGSSKAKDPERREEKPARPEGVRVAPPDAGHPAGTLVVRFVKDELVIGVRSKADPKVLDVRSVPEADLERIAQEWRSRHALVRARIATHGDRAVPGEAVPRVVEALMAAGFDEIETVTD